ncbi:MAG: hypothetical protein AB7S69_14180 [Salinivirgaceae bacterium]|jgi:hypothetical protein
MNDFALIKSNQKVYGFIYNNTELFDKTNENNMMDSDLQEYLFTEIDEVLFADTAYKTDLAYLNTIAQF